MALYLGCCSISTDFHELHCETHVQSSLCTGTSLSLLNGDLQLVDPLSQLFQSMWLWGATTLREVQLILHIVPPLLLEAAL